MDIFYSAALVTPTQICCILFQEHILGRIDVIRAIEYLILPCTLWPISSNPHMKYNHKEKFWISNLECYLTDSNKYRCFNRKKDVIPDVRKIYKTSLPLISRSIALTVVTVYDRVYYVSTNGGFVMSVHQLLLNCVIENDFANASFIRNTFEL